jgi:hypothetical protein
MFPEIAREQQVAVADALAQALPVGGAAR